MAYGRRDGMRGMPRSKSGHSAHTRMGLPRGNPLSGGGNFGKGRRRSGGRRRVVGASRRRY